MSPPNRVARVPVGHGIYWLAIRYALRDRVALASRHHGVRSFQKGQPGADLITMGNNAPPGGPGRFTKRMKKSGLVGLAIGVYAVAFAGLYPVIGGIVLSLSFIPVATAAWLFGVRIGLAVAVLAAPMNAALLWMAGESAFWSLTVGARGISGQMILFGTAVATGGLRDRSVRLHHQIERGRLAQRQLSEHLEAKDRFLASISHELRTPLTAVLGFSELLSELEPAELPDMAPDFTRSIREQALDASHIIEDLLVAARADMQSLQLHTEAFSLREQVVAVLDVIGASECDVGIAAGDAQALADPLRVRQIVRNLLNNAIRYGGDSIRVTIEQRGRECSVQVTDDGPGIPPKELDRIFEPYHSLSDDRSKPGSVGVGLSVARQLADLMGGRLSCTSAPGECTFELIIPAAGPHAHSSATSGQERPLSANVIATRIESRTPSR